MLRKIFKTLNTLLSLWALIAFSGLTVPELLFGPSDDTRQALALIGLLAGQPQAQFGVWQATRVAVLAAILVLVVRLLRTLIGPLRDGNGRTRGGNSDLMFSGE